ncbi:hypothetical protein IEQ34_026228 [Dendrobium chrysotoxum]|uniref:phospholipase D n=1 Tax=Dendrobium chrysotoxum TaxID=161865 RepID=A0AAV7FN32_DENCH|nr:hypothetical protein IEQ34_026228 [Dendrobium chrysotoxum]
MDVQVVRSCADWSNGTLTETSIQNAYIEMIREAIIAFISKINSSSPQHSLAHPSLVIERILSAARDKRKFKIVVIIPTIPCFAGELDEAAGIRCIMAWQYKTISRGGKSIMEQCEQAGVDASEYISFYNLRGIDRIQSAHVREMERKSGVTFHEAQVAAARIFLGKEGYVSKKATVSIRIADDSNRKDSEKEERQGDSYVTEETYVHSKLIIVDDRKVLIGSANLNDRSQKGYGDSETAVWMIDDKDMFESRMNGEKYIASRFAASFRRHLWRQHLGLIEPQFLYATKCQDVSD